MGDVYLARRDDGEVHQQVAVKLLRSDADRPALRERFLRERQVLASLNHPSIARLMDAGHSADGQPYFVMEFVEGVPVDEYASALNLRGRLELFLLICAAISHAHTHSIIHRDLKPSNILVDATGAPKLLDFGIAKVLTEAGDPTRTVERMLTPTYASPEQIRGDVQTIATDVFSLGAILYQLITGRLPRERWSGSREHLEETITPPSRLNLDLPRDLDYIVLKALRCEPGERYACVERLADDIRSLLDSRPVEARSGDRVYRIRKFLVRKRPFTTSIGVALAGLLLTAGVACTQRFVAENRLLKGRDLARTVLALDEAAVDVHGSSNPRYQLISLSKDYLEGVLTAARSDRTLALDVGRAYSLLARAQGLSIAAPMGQTAKAEDSLRQAATLVDPLLTGNPNDRDALLAAARISHDRMLAAETSHRKEETLAHARKAVERLDTLLALGGVSSGRLEAVSEYLYQIAVTHKNLHRFDDAIQYSRRSIEISRAMPGGALRVSLGLSLLADLYRVTGELEKALATIRDARTHLERTVFPNDTVRRCSWITILWREGKILGAANGLGLNRTTEAIGRLQEAFDLIEDWTRNDAQGAFSRLFFVSIGRELGLLLRVRHPERALAVYDQSLHRLATLRDNAEARRGEAVLLAESAYALRRLGRNQEAGHRIDAALRVLTEAGEYPTSRSSRSPTAESVLRSLGDHLADVGQTGSAVKIYEQLLSRLEASKLDPRHDLRDAVTVSETYAALAALYRRGSMPDKAHVLDSNRVALWRQWDSRLPGNSVAQRQLELLRAR